MLSDQYVGYFAIEGKEKNREMDCPIGLTGVWQPIVNSLLGFHSFPFLNFEHARA
jgi:hypothetical protein